MKILVTVGTTPFETLMIYADQNLHGHEIRFQISSGHYIPQSGTWFRFEEIHDHYLWADLIITHAGAGSVYTLLEIGKKIIVVPNLERRDPHQQELARYIQKIGAAIVLWQPSEIADAVLTATSFTPAPYSCYGFFKGEEISRILLSDFPSIK